METGGRPLGQPRRRWGRWLICRSHFPGHNRELVTRTHLWEVPGAGDLPRGCQPRLTTL